MVAVQSPLVDLKYDDQTGLYIGALERQIMGLTMNEVKYQALLEYLTGQPWNDLSKDLEEKEIEQIAIAATEKKLGVTMFEAKRIVRERKEAADGVQHIE